MSDLIDKYSFSADPIVVQRNQAKYVQWFPLGGKVLDVGCGRGLFLELLRKAQIQAEGVDKDRGAVRETEAKGLKCHQADATTFLKVQNETYEGIFCSNFLEHFAPEDVFSLLKGFEVALKPGGRLVLVTPNPRNHQMLTETFWLDPTHVRFYPRLFLKQTLEALGFTIIAAGDDPDTRIRPEKFLKRAIVLILKLILPETFFEGEEAYVVAQKCDA